MARLGPKLTRSLKHAHAAPRDSFSFCLKDRTSLRRLNTQRWERKISKSQSIKLPNLLVHSLWFGYTSVELFPSKRTKIAFTLKFHVTCLRCASMHRFAQTLIGGYGFSSPSPENDCSQTKFIKDGCNSQLGVRIGSEDFGGSRHALMGLAY